MGRWRVWSLIGNLVSRLHEVADLGGCLVEHVPEVGRLIDDLILHEMVLLIAAGSERGTNPTLLIVAAIFYSRGANNFAVFRSIASESPPFLALLIVCLAEL